MERLAELDQAAKTRQIPVQRPQRLVTAREHHIDMVITGAVMFAAGFLAAAITFSVLR